MTHAHTLTRHKDIQDWVVERRGLPAMVRSPNRFGEWRARLALGRDAQVDVWRGLRLERFDSAAVAR